MSKKKIRDLTEEEMEKICEKHCEKSNNCNGCPLQIGTDGCFRYFDIEEQIEVEQMGSKKIGQTTPLNKDELSIIECVNSLETLFKHYTKDSEFNYQLNSANSPFNQLKKLISWKPIEEYFDNKHDWVLVQFEEKKTGFRGLPEIAEFRTNDNKWHTNSDDEILDNYLAEMCKPIAFMELNADLLKGDEQ